MVARKTTKPESNRTQITSKANVDLFTWAGNGNLGDDWIFEVGKKHFPNARVIKENWCKYPQHWGSRCLTHSHDKDNVAPILLWGGGWLASDQKKYRTVRRWDKHVKRAKSRGRKLFGFGLGMGPFSYDLSQASSILASMKGKLWVRASADLSSAAKASPTLASDCTLLEFTEISNQPQASKTWDYLISLPHYRQHWQNQVEGLDEARYHAIINELLSTIPSGSRTAFMVSVNGDLSQWGETILPILKPQSPKEMSGFIASARCLVTARLHPGLMAAMHGLDVIAIAYHHKFSILEEFGISVVWGSDNSDISDVANAKMADRTKLLDAAVRTESALKQLNRQLG